MNTFAKSMMRIASVGLILAVMVACGGDDDATTDENGDTAPPQDPTGWTWTLVELNGQPLVENTVIDMTLTSDEASGTGGCNGYNGAITIDGSSFTVATEMARTMMACEDAIMAQEDAYLAALADVATFEIVDDDLLLMDADGTVVARFNP